MTNNTVMLVALILGAGLLMSEGVPEDPKLSGKDFLTEFGDPLFDDTLNLEQSEEERVLERVLATRTNTQSDVARLNDAQVTSGASDASPAELAKKVEKLVTGKLSEWCACKAGATKPSFWCADATVSTAMPALHEPVCGVFIEDSQNNPIDSAIQKGNGRSSDAVLCLR